jgi:hypothetical protein
MAKTSKPANEFAAPGDMERRNWLDLAYLRRGNPRQRAAFEVLQALKIHETLVEYTPVLAGTIPLGIDIPGSDLDVLCEQHAPQAFIACLERAYGHCSDFSYQMAFYNNLETVIVNFKYGGFSVEIFGQPQRVIAQNAFRHMQIEARLLEIGGEAAHRALRELKSAGLKTEPAFAQYFNLPGDPYQTLLDLWALEQPTLVTYLGAG